MATPRYKVIKKNQAQEVNKSDIEPVFPFSLGLSFNPKIIHSLQIDLNYVNLEQ